MGDMTMHNTNKPYVRRYFKIKINGLKTKCWGNKANIWHLIVITLNAIVEIWILPCSRYYVTEDNK